ncbi:SIS domain-containing protein [Schleiferilactobacillus harbinensis]|jgi:DNA-binding MurR/RpiR family transcriptional regulator|nr:MurR/RpiR family transcriptional regulator [Schleiferilactobacillus harbinensis]HAY52895.1 MurR/RpiR family transcriptional regulator [Lactobacillus sp.]MBO3091777.1 MurR/RpiR family transcriptional regulator [Schleiferilactobacillus harbinensis]MCI1784021.1 MurR/RpiR family transcriptional regulator [Schleiferilactobacillus harbinensis]MCI1849542.1 MurR/RpiR family transcriptional regulator [Schleiferilactobacillus harbinensis]MCT2908827.1 MurR/RpiR family transcriptional regulator [Schlei
MAENIIDVLYSRQPGLSATERKIAAVILADPGKTVNMTISELAQAAAVSDASVSRFCRTLGLAGFHELKIELAKVAEDKDSYYRRVDPNDLEKSLQGIAQNKVAEITGTLSRTPATTVRRILQALQTASMVQVIAAGGTFPVAADAVYKFNQLGILAVADQSWETAIGQTMNLPKQAVMLVISNSGETRNLLKQMAVAKDQGVPVIAITNRADSPIGLQADLHLITAVRQQILQSEYFFSRVAAMSAVEALFLLLLAQNKPYLDHIKQHEALVAATKL